MLIRSQDKKVMINFDNVCQVRTGGLNDDRLIVLVDDIVVVLGQYSSEEKALKVLDMINYRYQTIWDVENGFTSGGNNFSSIFQMPQDSEV